MRVILDTNVLVSGFFSAPPYRILEAWRNGKLQLPFGAGAIDYASSFKIFSSVSISSGKSFWRTEARGMPGLADLDERSALVRKQP